MRWLSVNQSRILHIPEWVGSSPMTHCRVPIRTYGPERNAEWVNWPALGDRVCKNCARSARRSALHLLAQAEGRNITDPVVES